VTAALTSVLAGAPATAASSKGEVVFVNGYPDRRIGI
jgi:hypothetical protein